MRLILTVSVKATLRPGAGMRARGARPYGMARRGPWPRLFWRAEVVAQASFSCRCAAIHLLAPYGVESVLLTLLR